MEIPFGAVPDADRQPGDVARTRIPDISPPVLPVEGVEVFEARAWGAEPQVILDGAYLL